MNLEGLGEKLGERKAGRSLGQGEGLGGLCGKQLPEEEPLTELSCVLYKVSGCSPGLEMSRCGSSLRTGPFQEHQAGIRPQANPVL